MRVAEDRRHLQSRSVVENDGALHHRIEEDSRRALAAATMARFQFDRLTHTSSIPNALCAAVARDLAGATFKGGCAEIRYTILTTPLPRTTQGRQSATGVRHHRRWPKRPTRSSARSWTYDALQHEPIEEVPIEPEDEQPV